MFVELLPVDETWMDILAGLQSATPWLTGEGAVSLAMAVRTYSPLSVPTPSFLLPWTFLLPAFLGYLTFNIL